MLYDPILDTSNKTDEHDMTDGKAYWIWYPGQRVAHLHKEKIKTSQKRFKYLGYPGTFRQPIYVAYYKRTLTVDRKQIVRWDGLGSCRMRMSINDMELDMTCRETALEAGDYKLFVSIDFADTLPCFYMEGGDANTSHEWLVSLDKQVWQEAAYLPEYNRRDRSPMSSREISMTIAPKHITCSTNLLQEGPHYVNHGAGHMVIDFGYYELGKVTCQAKGEGTLKMVVGQSLEEVQEQDDTFLEQIQKGSENLQSAWQTYGSSTQACRYAKITLKGSIEVKSMMFHAQVWPVTYHGRFLSDDALLNACWSMGAATVHSCMHEFFLDAIYRDALPWALDGFCAMEASDYLFFDEQMAHQHIMSQMLPLHSDMSDLGVIYLDFQLHTLLGIEYNYLVRKNKTFLKACKNVMDHTLATYMALQDASGFIHASTLKGAHFFPDWAVNEAIGPDVYGTPSYVQMMLMHCFEFAAYASGILGDEIQQALYTQQAKRLRKHIVDVFYDQEQGVFRNGYFKNGKMDGRFTIFSQVFGILYDLVPDDKYALMALAIKNGTVKRHPSISLNYYFELQALCQLGETDMALASIRRHIGGIIASGDVRVYEDIHAKGLRTLDFYGRKYGKSLCHGVMGAAPVTVLSKYVMGIQPRCTEGLDYSFKPLKSSLKKVEGSVPTPKGAIHVYYDEKTTLITIPQGVTVYLHDYETEKGQTSINKQGKYHLRKR